MNSKGVVLCAMNNSQVNYIKLAEFASKRIEKFLKVPVTLITDDYSLDSITDKTLFDKVITVSNESYSTRTFRDGLDIVSKTEWKNSHRDSVFYLTPYEETLVLDVDYVVNSEILSSCWNSTHDFLIYKDFFDLAQRKSNREFKFVSDYSIDFYWATVFWFRKTQETESFFNLVSHIKNNWSYFRLIYQIDSATFRNDYAFSIAIHMMNGFNKGVFANYLPGKLFYILDRDYLCEINNSSMTFLVKKENTVDDYIPIKTNSLDVHVMNKFSLLRVLDNE